MNFKKELENKVSPHDRTHNDNELFLGGVLVEHFKDWQPPKPLVVVPKLVADWFRDRMVVSFLLVILEYSFSVYENEDEDEAITWVHDNGGLDLLCKMKLYGYTVEKEQLYILKHIDMSKFSKGDSLYLSRSIKEEVFGKYNHRRIPDNADMSKAINCHFTQSEIDKLNIGSYEQIEVEP